MLCIIKDREKDVGLYVSNSNIEVRDCNEVLQAKYRIDALHNTLSSMMKLFKIGEEDLYNYAISALYKLASNTKDLNVSIRVGKNIEVRNNSVWLKNLKCDNIEVIKKEMSAKELFIRVINNYKKYGFDVDNKLKVLSVEYKDTVVKSNELVKKNNRVMQVLQMDMLLEENNVNERYVLVTYWGNDKPELEQVADLVNYKNSINEQEKENYIKRRRLIGEDVVCKA